ncbi:hypothetical protein MKW98_001844 [Papaver atlanticum]|uniref:Uncharacterized protein n=1 Tax=Papaver atlanticum TaxID=357466 RepID=A0AAD4SBI0_9MAGN|nr:hypothetical protein MKW98_001844 [Papaver atlanticum]
MKPEDVFRRGKEVIIGEINMPAAAAPPPQAATTAASHGVGGGHQRCSKWTGRMQIDVQVLEKEESIRKFVGKLKVMVLHLLMKMINPQMVLIRLITMVLLLI